MRLQRRRPVPARRAFRQDIAAYRKPRLFAERDFGRTYAVVGTAKPYAAAHQFGAVTKPHVIRARNGKALKIPGVGFRRSVNHPGSTIPTRPFLGIGPDDEKELLDIFRDELHKALYG